MEKQLNKIIEELDLKENETLVLFLNDTNGWRTDNPLADLVIVENYDYEKMKEKERKIPGVYNQGSNCKEVLTVSNLNYKILISGKRNDFVNGDIVKYIKETYHVISGNY